MLEASKTQFKIFPELLRHPALNWLFLLLNLIKRAISLRVHIKILQ